MLLHPWNCAGIVLLIEFKTKEIGSYSSWCCKDTIYLNTSDVKTLLKSWAWCYMTLIRGFWEAEAGGWLSSRSAGL